MNMMIKMGATGCRMAAVAALWLASAVVISGTLQAQSTCAELPEGTLLHTCQGEVSARIRILPEEEVAQAETTHSVTVTGAYSSGDRFGVEGLAIRDGELISGRWQGWDGIMIIDPKHGLSLHTARNVMLRGTRYDLTVRGVRHLFVRQAKALKLSVLQSHLLISGGELDLRDVADAPSFKRRLLFTDRSGHFGLYETSEAVTLYDAAVDIQAAFDPQMVFNLDMGAYDFCQRRDGENVENCGALFVSEGNLTNLLEFSWGE